MADLAFDFAGARKAGFTDAQIADYLVREMGVQFDLAGARKAGFSDTDIVGYIEKQGEAITVTPLEDLNASRPARMTLGLTGQSRLADDATYVDASEPGPRHSAIGPAAEARANEYAKRVGDAASGRVGGTELELLNREQMDRARETAMADPVRNISATVEAVPETAKKVAGGLIQATAEGAGGRPLAGMPAEQLSGPAGPAERDWKDALADIGSAIGTAADLEEKKLKSGLKPGLATEAVQTAIESLVVMAPSIISGGAAAAFGGAAARAASQRALFGTMGVSTFGQSYGEARRAGLDPAQAGAYGVVQAGIEVGTEFAPLRELFKRHPNVAQKFANFMAVEVPQELLATTLQAAVDKASVNPNMTWEDFEKQLKLTVLSTPLAGGAQAGAIHAAQRLRPEGSPAEQIARELQASVDATEVDPKAVDQIARAALDPNRGVTLGLIDSTAVTRSEPVPAGDPVEAAATVLEASANAAPGTEVTAAIAAAEAAIDGKTVAPSEPLGDNQLYTDNTADSELAGDTAPAGELVGDTEPSDVLTQRAKSDDLQSVLNAELSRVADSAVVGGVVRIEGVAYEAVDPRELPTRADLAGVRGAAGRVDPQAALPQRVTQEEAAAVAALAEQLGVKAVRFYRDSPQHPDGFVLRDRDVLYLSDSPQRAATFVAAHELTHTAETIPGLNAAVNAIVDRGLTDAGLAYAEKVHGRDAPKGDTPEGKRARRAFLVSELKADLGGWALNDPTFLPKVVAEVEAQQGPEAAKGVLRKLIDGIAAAIRRVQEVFGRKERDRSAEFVTNLEEVRAGLAKLYAAKFGQAEADRVQRVAEERAKLSGMQRSGKVRPYGNAPDSLMGFRKHGPQKGYEAATGYRKEITVRVTWPDGQSMVDGMRGLNTAHALERARRNWKGAEVELVAAESYNDYAEKNPDVTRSRKETGDHGRRVGRKARAAEVTPKEAEKVRAYGFKVLGNVVAGAPEFIRSFAALKKQIDRAVADALSERAHPEDAVWYREAGRGIREYSHGDRALMERLTRIIAKLSQADGVPGNVTQVIKAAYQIAAGETPAAGRYPNKFRDEFAPLIEAPTFDTSLKGVNRKLQNFYRNLHDEAFEKNDWPDAVVIDRHAVGYIWNNRKKSTVDSDAQYDYAERLIQKAAAEYNRREGTTLKPRDMQALLWGWWKRADDAAAARAKGQEYKAEGKAWNYGDYFARATANVTAETIPSVKLSGLDQAMSPADKRAFTREALALIQDGQGLNELARRSGLVLFTQSESTGGYEGKINPNVLTGALARKDAKTAGAYHRFDYTAVDRYALAWQYIFRQDGVPWFRADPELDPARLDAARARRAAMRAAGKTLNEENEPPAMSQGFFVVLGEDLTETSEQALYEAMRQDIAGEVGYTKVKPNVVAVVNYRGDDGAPFLMPDEAFRAGVAKLAELGIVQGVEPFAAESRYHYHDYAEENTGERILKNEAVESGQPELRDWLRGRRAAFDALTRGWEERLARRAEEVTKSAKARDVTADEVAAEFEATAKRAGGPERYERLKAAGKTELPDYRTWVLVRTPAFKRWFGDWESFLGQTVWADDKQVVSKVVHPETGEPLVVYHGTTRGGFGAFEPQGAADRPESVFFAAHRATAASYAGTRNDVEIQPEDSEQTMRGIYPVFLNIRNPSEVDFEGANWDGTYLPGTRWMVEIDGEGQFAGGPNDDGVFPSREDAEVFAENQFATESDVEVVEAGDRFETTNSVVRVAEEYGYDGAIIRRVVDDGGEGASFEETDVFVIFRPEQAKSIWNVGTFDPAKAEILRSPKTYRDGSRITATPEFKAWFGGSVVTENGKPGGKPLPVFHATSADITEFAPAQAAPAAGRRLSSSRLSWFSDVDFANRFVDEVVLGPRIFSDDPAHGTPERLEQVNRWKADADKVAPAIYPVYLRLANPLDLTALGNVLEEPTPTAVARLSRALKIPRPELQGLVDEALAAAEDDMWADEEETRPATLAGLLQTDMVASALASSGFDGVIAVEDGHVIYGVKGADQIKSVFNTRPTDAPDITRSAKDVQSTDGESQNASQGPVVRGDARRAEEGRAGAPRDGGEVALSADRAEALARVPEGFSRQVGPATPLVQFRRGAHPIAVVGVHYGKVEGLAALDGRKFGTGARSEEAARIPSWHPLNKRVYFYAQDRDQRLPESERVVTGPYVYRALVDNLYDFQTDPENLIEQWRAFKATPEFQASRVDPWTALENAVLASGYDGYLNRQAGALVVMGRDSVPAEFLGDRGEAWQAITRSAKARPAKAFREWFGDSKVVDENGDPLVVYHGTAGDFTVFEQRDGYTEGGSELKARGVPAIWFTDDRDIAQGFADGAEGDGRPARVIAARLRIERPYVIHANGDPWHKFTDQIVEAYESGQHDGVILHRLRDGMFDDDDISTVYVVFDSAQVKDVANKRPTDSPDITRSAKQRETEEFKRWAGGAQFISREDSLAHEFRSGVPVVVEALHGTTGDFTKFSRERASPESDLGAGFYASNNPRDVAANYAGEGPDLTNKIERTVERNYDGDLDASDLAMARDEARRELGVQHLGLTMPVYVRFRNPAVLGGRGETYLEWRDVQRLYSAFAKAAAEYGDVYGLERVLAKLEEGPLRDAKVALTTDLEVHDENGMLANSEVFRAALERMGFDGVIDQTVSEKFRTMDGMDEPGTTHFVAFKPNQIKSAIGNRGTFNRGADITRSAKPIWYSDLERTLEKAGMAAAPASAWRDWLRGQSTKGGVKPDELEWSGVNDWLAMQNGKVAKDQVLGFVRANGVRVEETVRDDTPDALSPAEVRRLNDLEDADNRTYEQDEELAALQSRFGAQNDNTKFAEWQLPGGKNYREILLTLPQSTPVASKEERMLAAGWTISESGGTWSVRDEKGSLVSQSGSRERAIETVPADRVPALAGEARARFQSSHFDEPDILAHIRLNERTDAEGKRVLFVEEIQSDWAQKGKRDGFRERGHPDYDRLISEFNTRMAQKYGYSNEPPYLRVGLRDERMSDAERAELHRIVEARESANQLKGVPVAPFVDKTEKWVSLALKRVIRYAAEHGFDRVAWTTGEQQADRYDLSKKIADVTYDRNGDGTYVVAAHGLDQRTVWRDLRATEKTVEEHLGKDIAKRIFEGGEAEGVLRGLDLKVGGEGMRAFYDKIVPNVANDVLKKLGGGRVGTVHLGKGGYGVDRIIGRGWMIVDAANHPVDSPRFKKQEDALRWIVENDPTRRQPSFDITPALREKALGGMPTFSRKFDFRVGDEVVHKRTGQTGTVDVVRPRPYTYDDVEFIDAKGDRQFARDTELRHAGTVQRSAKSAIVNTGIAQSWAAPELTEFDAVVRALQDKLVDTKRVVHAIRAAGAQIAENIDPYLQETLYHGRASKRVSDFALTELRPLLQDMQARGVGMQELEDFLWASHARERNTQIARVNPTMPDGGSGLTNREAADILAGQAVTVHGRTIQIDPARTPAYLALQARIDAITNRTLDTLVSYGLESKETVQAWRDAYRHYVPLRRDLEADANYLGAFNLGLGTGQGFSVRGSHSKRAMGSERNVVDILANVAMQRERAIVRGEKNRIAQALYGLAVKAPNPDFWLALNPDLRLTTRTNALYEEWMSTEREYRRLLSTGLTMSDPAMTSLELKYLAARDKYNDLKPKAQALQTRVERELVALGLNPADAASIAREPQERYIDPNTGMVAWRLNPRLTSQPEVLALRINGEPRFVVFSNDERAKAMVAQLKNLEAENLGWFLQNSAKIARWFASVNTQYNPVFGVVNGFRDAGALVLNLGSTPLRGQQAKILKYAGQALVGIYSDLRAHRAGRQPSSVWAQRFEDMGFAGGQTGYRDMFQTSADRADALTKELEALATGKVARWFKISETNPVFAWLSDYNTTIENSIRVGTYQAAIDAGLSQAEAAKLAKNITVNFNKKGTAATGTGALYAFFNAAVQGTARITETMFENTGNPSKLGDARLSSLGKKIIVGGVLLGVIQALLGFAAGWDDDEPKQFQRERNFIVPVPGTDKYVSLPMPLGYHVLPNIGRIATEFALSKGKDPAKRLMQLLSVVVGAFNPVGGGDFVDAITPTAADPAIALARNKDWTGRSIAQEDMNKFRPTPGWTRAKDTSTPWARGLSYAINYVTGGGQFGKGVVSPSPDQIDYLIGQVTGGVGREAGKLAQTVRSPATGEELPLYKVPLVGRFVGETTGTAAVASKFYANLERIGEHYDPLKQMVAARETAKVQAYYAEHPEARLLQAAAQFQDRVGDLNREKRKLVKEGADKARVRALEERARLVMGQFNELVQRSTKK